MLSHRLCRSGIQELLIGWLWLKAAHEVEVRRLARPVVTSEGSGSGRFLTRSWVPCWWASVLHWLLVRDFRALSQEPLHWLSNLMTRQLDPHRVCDLQKPAFSWPDLGSNVPPLQPYCMVRTGQSQYHDGRHCVWV